MLVKGINENRAPDTDIPFVIHFLLPLTIQNLPSSDLTAVVLRLLTSEPAYASEMASEMNFLPADAR